METQIPHKKNASSLYVNISCIGKMLQNGTLLEKKEVLQGGKKKSNS